MAQSLMNGSQIRSILVNKLGFRDLQAYRDWARNVRPTMTLASKYIQLLSPDVVDCRAFWRVCEELYGTDPICNVTTQPILATVSHDIAASIDANRMNLRLAKSLAITYFLEENAHSRLNVLEVGPGYGSLKTFIEANTNHVYVGIDVVPRLPGILETTNDGLIPRAFLEQRRESFSYVVASNVFQHFSARQHARYIEDAGTLLHPGGLFLFNLTLDTGNLPSYMRDENGDAWSVHYGQYTPVPKVPSVYAELARTFDVLYVTQRYDGLFNFVCSKRPTAQPESRADASATAEALGLAT